MTTPPPLPRQCETIFRQDLRPIDTILPLQSQQLLTTLADDTASELQPIVIMPQYHGRRRSSAITTTAMIERPAEPTNNVIKERAPTSETMARRSSTFTFSTMNAATGSEEKSTAEAKKMPEPELKQKPNPEPKVQPRDDRIRRSRRQQ